MKFYLVLLLLLPLASEANRIRCFGNDFLLVNNELLDCNSKETQACFTRGSGEKGCTILQNCSRPGWKCCHTDRCNA